MKTLMFCLSLIVFMAAQVVPPITSEKFFPVLVKPNKQYIVWQDKMVETVKSFESYRPQPYLCPAGVLTVGYGHTGKYASRAMSKKQAEDVLKKELNECRKIVLRNVKVSLTEWQLCSLTSFTYNCGEGSLKKLINGPRRLNAGNYDSIKKIMPMYRKGGGRVLKGLVKRRAVEVDMWNGVVCLRG